MSAYYNELDAYPVQWIRNLVAAGHIAPGVIDARSIKEVTAADLVGVTQAHFFAGIGVWSHALRAAGWDDARPVWTGSCPCQPFSSAGKRAGTADARHLWPDWFELIKQCRPPVVLGEQVANGDGLAWLDVVQADLEGAGYAFAAFDLCAAGFGAPHIRQRLYFAGIRLADSASERLDGRRAGKAGDGRDAARVEPERLRNARGLADHRSEGRGQVGAHGGRSGAGGGAEGVDERPLHGGAFGDRRVIACGLGNSDSEHAGRHAGASTRAEEEGERRGLVAGRISDVSVTSGAAGSTPGPTNGWWSAADWLLCRDKPIPKWRPVEPGTFPLAHGAPQRVGRLRAYGNAIVAPQATEFVRAVMDFLQRAPLRPPP